MIEWEALLYQISIAFTPLLLTARVTFHTILEINDVFLQVLLTHLPFTMLMTAIAGICYKTAWMARRASCSTAVV